jgi:hypothetical protein
LVEGFEPLAVEVIRVHDINRRPWMGSRKTRLAALLIAGMGTVGMLGTTTGVAQATVPLTGLAGTFADQATCDASQAQSRATPNSIVAACSYYPAADMSVRIPRAGWYYRYALPGDAACGIGCHTPAPPPPDPGIPDGGGGGGGCTRIDCNPV